MNLPSSPRWSSPSRSQFFLLKLALIGILVAIAFRAVLFFGEQFGYRDAAHFYYPLYLKVQQEWAEGHLPLWEPEENAGMPLLGNPTAAVLYPGKLVFALFSYPWAYRLYTIGHTILSYITLFAFARALGIGRVGSTLGALGYAFGTPVLFQYCNIIFLVGAAWLPLGFLGAYRWVAQGKRSGLAWLALALAMEVLGGDPQIAYLTGLCAAFLVLMRTPRREIRWWVAVPAVLLATAAWIGLTFWLATKIPGWRPVSTNKEVPSAWFPQLRSVIALFWGIFGAIVLWRWRKPGDAIARRRRAGFAGLVAAGVVGGLIAAVQLLPSFEFTSLTLRAAREGPHDIYPFSLEPYRIIELIWPNAFGTMFGGSGHWLGLLPPIGGHEVWVPSLYLGVGTLLLAWAGLRWSRDDSGVPWLTWLALISLIASFGEFTSPLWWARWTETGIEVYGPHDDLDVAPIRKDGQLRDGDGGLYWAFGMFLPGFGQFRYPAKLFTITALCLSVLAGAGWDRLRDGRRLRFLIPSGLILALTAVLFALTWTHQSAILARLEPLRKMASALGVADLRGIIAEARSHLLHGGLALAAMTLCVIFARRRACAAGCAAIVVLAVDLLVANGPLIHTVPQSIFKASPKAIDLIEDDLREHPFAGPFRVHRVPIWNPTSWYANRVPDRVRQMTEWERQTIQPKYGINLGIEYTKTEGTAELYDYSFFFGGFRREIRPATAEQFKQLGLTAGDRVIYMPRKSFDFWNTRYFILPLATSWGDEHRGVLSFLTNCEIIYPQPDLFDGPDGDAKRKALMEEEDFQILRNRNAYPRAWLVRKTRKIDQPIQGLDREPRQRLMEEITYANDWLWSDPTRVVFDPREMAWIEHEDGGEIPQQWGTGLIGEEESVAVTARDSLRTELTAKVQGAPALVVLSDVFYPGWKLFVDGVETPILRVNRLMRGVVIPPGEHRILYVYEPMSVRLGAGLTLLGLIGLAALGIAARRQVDRPSGPPVM